MRGFVAIVRRDLRLAIAQGGSTLLAVAFFMIAVTLFPLGVGPEPQVLARIATGVVVVAALLAVLLSLDRLFQADFEDGSLELIALGGPSLPLLALAKILAHWLTTGLPLLIAAPLLAILMNMPAEGIPVLVLAMAIGTPTLSLIGAVGAALTVGIRRGGVLMSLLVLPLYVPVLIFAAAAVEADLAGLGARPHLLLLGAVLAISSFVGPLAAAAGLRLAME